MHLLYGSDIADSRGIAQDSFRLSFDGVRLNPDDQPKAHGMEAGDPDGHVSQLCGSSNDPQTHPKYQLIDFMVEQSVSATVDLPEC